LVKTTALMEMFLSVHRVAQRPWKMGGSPKHRNKAPI